MKAPAGRPGLDVRRGGERAAARGPMRPSAPRPAAATCPPLHGLRAAGRGPRAIKEPAGGQGCHRLGLLIKPTQTRAPGPPLSGPGRKQEADKREAAAQGFPAGIPPGTPCVVPGRGMRPRTSAGGGLQLYLQGLPEVARDP